MQQKTEKNTEKLQSSSEIENINGTQRKQLEQILKYDLQHIAVFPFDDTSETYAEGIADKSKALASFKMILVENITAHQKKALKSWDTLDSVEGVRKILYHEKPEGVASAEAGGLLNLVRYDDNTAPHITPEAVVQYIQLEVERRINALLASGIKPAEFPQIDLRSAIDEIDNSDLKQVFVDNLDACKKLIDKKISSFDNLHQFGLKNASALKELLENADAAIYLIKNEYLTFKQISDFGIKESIALYFLLKNHKAYISYVERGLTTFKKLLALVTGEYIYEAFEAFGSYPEAVEKLLALGISFADLYQFGMQAGSALKELLENVNAVVYLIKNKHLTYKQISDFGIKDSTTLYFLLQNHKAYISYVERGLTTFKELFALVPDKHIYEAFKVFGSYPEAVEKLLALGISFADLYQFGMQYGIAFDNLLENVDAAIYLIKNKHFTFKQMVGFSAKDTSALLCLLLYYEAYASYIARDLTTPEALLSLIKGQFDYEAFKALGSYSKSVEKLLALGISFADLYQLGMQPGYRFQNLLENLLEDLDSEASKEWINAHSTIIKRKHLEQSDEGRYFLQLVDKMENIEKKRLCILNGALLLQFVEKNNNITVNTILKLPLDVLKNFDNSKDYKILTDVFHDIGKMVEVFLKVGECAPSKAR